MAKMSILTTAIYKVNVTPIKIPVAFFTKIENTILKLMEPQKIPNAQSNQEKEKQTCKQLQGKARVAREGAYNPTALPGSEDSSLCPALTTRMLTVSSTVVT